MRNTQQVADRRDLREYFGGFDFPAAFVGMLTSVAMVLILGGIVGAIAGNSVDYQAALSNVEEATATAAVVSLLILFVSFFVGGWAAGRMARFDGVRNGVLAAIMAIVLSVVLGSLTAYVGDAYNVVPNLDLNRFADTDTLTSAGIIGALLALAAILVSSALGGMYGERYHEAIDARLANAAPAGAVLADGPVVHDAPLTPTHRSVRDEAGVDDSPLPSESSNVRHDDAL